MDDKMELAGAILVITLLTVWFLACLWVCGFHALAMIVAVMAVTCAIIISRA